MSARYLGKVFDIHGGGLDLIFPHHENEIAQSRCAHGTHVMANVWMHNGFVQVEGRKMSKSEGNFVTINELLESDRFGGRKWPGEVLRLAMLMTHYREPIDFSVKRLEEAEGILRRWRETSRLFVPERGSVSPKVLASIADDLSFSEARVELDRLQKTAEHHKRTHQDGIEAGTLLASTLVWLGMTNDEDYNLIRQRLAEKVDKAIENYLNAEGCRIWELNRLVGDTNRQSLKLLKAKNFAEADRIRNELAEKGIQLKDGKDKETGERVTTWEVKR